MAEETKLYEILGAGEGGATVGMHLEDFMSIDLTNVEAVAPGFYTPPAGMYQFEGDDVETRDINGKPSMAVKMNIIAVVDLANKALDVNEPIGKEYAETIFWPNDEGLNVQGLGKMLGNYKHFMESIGMKGNMSAEQLRMAFKGYRFEAPIVNMKSSKDADRIFARIVREKARPIENAGVEATVQAAAEPAPAAAG